MVYLVKENDKVRVFESEEKMKAAGFSKATKTISDEEFNSNGCYPPRVIDGKIVVGKTEAEKAEEAKQAEIDEYMSRLEAIDREAGACRTAREACIAVANLSLVMGITTQQINAETDPAKKAAMKAIADYTPEKNPGLEKFIEMETQAVAVRESLSQVTSRQ